MIRIPLFGSSAQAESNDSTPAGGPDAASAASKQEAHPLDAMTGGIFSAATSGERAARVRAWLATDPDLASMQEVFKELSARDKGAAKALREKLDEIRRSKGQELLAAEWATRAEQLLQGSKINIADAMAWQRDAAKAGAPLSKEPLATLRQQLAERVRGIEDLQTRTQVHREAAVLLAQRIEILSTKSWSEADAADAGLQADVAHWREQALALQQDPHWPSVDAKYVSQLDSAMDQLQLVVKAFEEALAHTRAAVADATQPLPSVPVWADEVRLLRGQAIEPEPEVELDPALAAEKQAEQAKRRSDAEAAVQAAVTALEQELGSGHSKASVAAAQALRNALKEHRRNLGAELEGKANAVLASAGELEGWQRWRADQIRQELVQQAEALIERPSAAEEAAPATPLAAAEAAGEGAASETPAAATDAAAPTIDASTVAPAAAASKPKAAVAGKAQAAALPVSKLSPRKLQETLRQLREQWKQTDQGGAPNHALWKRFDAACNEAYRIVEAWLASMKEHATEQKAARMHLLEELKAWGAAHAQQVQAGAADWKAAHRELLQFSKRWRESGHLSEKVFVELQPRWKAAMQEAGAHLEAAQKASVQLRHAMIEEAKELGAAASLRIDAIKALQQRWQHEAQGMPLDRRQEQKLWDAFRKPLDEAFQRKQEQREQAQASLSAHDQQVLDAARALEAANAGGDAQAIHAAMRVLDAAIKGRQQAVADAPVQEGSEAGEQAVPASEDQGAGRAPAVSASQPRPAIAVRGDDRPQARLGAGVKPAAGRQDERGRRDGAPRGRFGERSERPERAPRLGDAAFRAQREALDHAQSTLRKLSEQAHGVTITQLLEAWEKRQPDTVPAASELGKAVAGAQRNRWAAALSAQAAAGEVDTAMLRLEMAADVPTPAAQLSARRMLQLQMLTRRNDPSPAETWTTDVATVLAGTYDAAQARRLQQALKVLLRK